MIRGVWNTQGSPKPLRKAFKSILVATREQDQRNRSPWAGSEASLNTCRTRISMIGKIGRRKHESLDGQLWKMGVDKRAGDRRAKWNWKLEDRGPATLTSLLIGMWSHDQRPEDEAIYRVTRQGMCIVGPDHSKGEALATALINFTVSLDALQLYLWPS